MALGNEFTLYLNAVKRRFMVNVLCEQFYWFTIFLGGVLFGLASIDVTVLALFVSLAVVFFFTRAYLKISQLTRHKITRMIDQMFNLPMTMESAIDIEQYHSMSAPIVKNRALAVAQHHYRQIKQDFPVKLPYSPVFILLIWIGATLSLLLQNDKMIELKAESTKLAEVSSDWPKENMQPIVNLSDVIKPKLAVHQQIGMEVAAHPLEQAKKAESSLSDITDDSLSAQAAGTNLSGGQSNKGFGLEQNIGKQQHGNSPNNRAHPIEISGFSSQNMGLEPAHTALTDAQIYSSAIPGKRHIFIYDPNLSAAENMLAKRYFDSN